MINFNQKVTSFQFFKIILFLFTYNIFICFFLFIDLKNNLKKYFNKNSEKILIGIQPDILEYPDV